jgi:hypothetical protein
VGQEVKLSVTATSSVPVSYRWQFRGRNIPDETNATLRLDAQLSDSGDYAVIVTVDGLSIRSAPAFLVVSNPPVATPQTVEGFEDASQLITLDGFDPSGLPLTASIVRLPARGSLFQFNTTGASEIITTVPALVSDPNWRVVYVPEADGNGTAFDEFFFVVGNEIGDSAPARVMIDVQPVNDPPGFAKGPDQTMLEDAGLQTIAAWAGNIVAGPSNEAQQRLEFIVTNDNATLFSVQPAIDAAGTLTFAPAPNAYGSATVTALLRDDGGTDHGGLDTSAVQSFLITVLPVNDVPVAVARVLSLEYLVLDGTNVVVISPNNSNAIVVLDGSLSSDIENDPLEYLWLEEGMPFGAEIRVAHPFAVGSHAITLQVFDGTDAGSGGISLEVITSSDAVATLIVTLEEVDLERRSKRALITTLKAASAAFERGQFHAGANQLRALQNKIRAQTGADRPELAAMLIAAAQAIIDSVEEQRVN